MGGSPVPKLRYRFRVRFDAIRGVHEQSGERWTVAYTASQAETFVLRQLERELHLPLRSLARDQLVNCLVERRSPVVRQFAVQPELF